MLIDTNTAIAVRCDICGTTRLYDISLFDLPKYEKKELRCECGHINAILAIKDYKFLFIEVPCFTCQDTHVFKYKLNQLVRGNFVTRCVETGAEICFIGKNNYLEEMIKENKLGSKEIFNELGFYDYFENFEVMMQSLNKIKDLIDKGNIKCDCGNSNIETELFPDRIELKCKKCKSIHIIYSENEEDLKNLIDREQIIMHEHSFVCIDSMKHNNDRR